MDLVTEQKLERRDRILAGARELLAERGHAALTMRDLAAHCRVSVPTLYNQFGGKDALLAEAVQSHFASLLARVRRSGGRRGHERVLRVVTACAEEMARLPDYHRALLRAFMAAPETAALQTALGEALSSEIREGLAEMQRRRQLAGWVLPEVLARRVTTACIGASAAWLSGELGDAGLRAAMRHAAAVMLAGCARGGARDALEATARTAQGQVARDDAERRGAPPAAAEAPPRAVRGAAREPAKRAAAAPPASPAAARARSRRR